MKAPASSRFIIAVVLFASFTQPTAAAGQQDAILANLWHWSLAAAKPKYAEIIERNRNDRASNSTFRRACRQLATRVFREECEDYGYICPPIGADIWKWPAEIDADVVAELKANVPALRHCPDVYVLEVPLPIRRFPPRITCEMVEKEASGWVVVDLLIDDEGNVSQASISQSTSKLLEDPAIVSARQFQYQKILGASGYLEGNNVQATVYFDFDEVQGSGACEAD